MLQNYKSRRRPSRGRGRGRGKKRQKVDRDKERDILSFVFVLVWFLQLSLMKPLFLVIDENSRKQNDAK